MKTRMRKMIVMLLASAMVFTMTVPGLGAESMPDGAAAIEETDFSVQAYTGKGDNGYAYAPEEDSFADVPENWDVDSDPGTWSTATKYVKLAQGQEYYDGEDIIPDEDPEFPEEGDDDGWDDGDDGWDDGDDGWDDGGDGSDDPYHGAPLHGAGTTIYWFRIKDTLFNNVELPDGGSVEDYINDNSDVMRYEDEGDGWYRIISTDYDKIYSLFEPLSEAAYEWALEMDCEPSDLLSDDLEEDEGEDYAAGVQWVVYSPFSYFFGSPDNNYVLDGKVIQRDGDKYSDNYAYKAVPVDPEKKIYALLCYWTVEQDRLGEHIIVSRFDAKSNKWVEDDINTRYNGNEMVLPYTGAKHMYDDGKGVKNAKKDKDIFVDAVLVSYNAAAKKTSVIKGLYVKNAKVKNNAAATVPGENWVYPTDTKNRAGSFGYSRIEKEGEDPTVTYSGFTSAPQLTANENKKFKGQPSFTVKAAAVGDAKPFLKAVNKALKKEAIPFEISQFRIGTYKEDTLDADWIFEKALTGIEDEEKLAAEIEALDKEAKAVHEKYLKEYAAAVKVQYPDEYAGLTDQEIMDSLADPDAERRIVLDMEVEPDIDWDEQQKPVAYRRCIEFRNVPFYVDPEIDLLAFENGGNNMGDVVELDSSNEKGGTTLKFNKKGKSKLKLVLLDFVNIYKEVKNTIVNAGDEEQQVYKRKAYPRKVKLSKKAGGKQDVFVQDMMTPDGVPFVVLNGQNNMYGSVLMRLKTNIHGVDEIAVGHYKDENHYYIESVE